MAPRFCVGSPSWAPDAYIDDTELNARTAALLAQDDLHSAIATSFAIPKRDSYVYHAIVSVTLPEVQHAVSAGDVNGMHRWYLDPASDPSSPQPLPPPPRPDVDSYLSIFSPTTATPAALKGFLSNAKKGSVRAEVASYLASKRFLHPQLPTLAIPKRKTPPPNPYFDFLSWTSRTLEWCGPCHLSEAAPSNSHHVLPVLMHHFGCACPSYEALEMIKSLALPATKGGSSREVIDMGSGNGYWSFMLRRHGIPAVTPVDSAQSSWRVTWVPDTTITDGAGWLKQKRKGAADAILLLVYPIVGGGVAGGEEGGFTKGMMAAYKGDTLVVVGTQNHNGYTGFRGQSMDEFMDKEHGDENGWVKIAQVPLPSFPGKDEAMFIFMRGERAPRRADGDGGDSKS